MRDKRSRYVPVSPLAQSESSTQPTQLFTVWISFARPGGDICGDNGFVGHYIFPPLEIVGEFAAGSAFPRLDLIGVHNQRVTIPEPDGLTVSCRDLQVRRRMRSIDIDPRRVRRAD